MVGEEFPKAAEQLAQADFPSKHLSAASFWSPGDPVPLRPPFGDIFLKGDAVFSEAALDSLLHPSGRKTLPGILSDP